MALWGEEMSVVRGWGFLLVARVGRGREHCARMEFFVGCKSWKRKRALCENEVFLLVARVGRGQDGHREEGGYLWPEEPI
jgi:hypothetical protein